MGDKIDQALNNARVEVEFDKFLDSVASRSSFLFIDDPKRLSEWKRSQKSLRRVNGLLKMMLGRSPRFRAYCQKISLNSRKRLIGDSRLLVLSASSFANGSTECVFLCFDFEPPQFSLRRDKLIDNAPLVEVTMENHNPKDHEALWSQIESIKNAKDLIQFLGLTSGVYPD